MGTVRELPDQETRELMQWRRALADAGAPPDVADAVVQAMRPITDELARLPSFAPEVPSIEGPLTDTQRDQIRATVAAVGEALEQRMGDVVGRLVSELLAAHLRLELCRRGLLPD